MFTIIYLFRLLFWAAYWTLVIGVWMIRGMVLVSYWAILILVGLVKLIVAYFSYRRGQRPPRPNPVANANTKAAAAANAIPTPAVIAHSSARIVAADTEIRVELPVDVAVAPPASPVQELVYKSPTNRSQTAEPSDSFAFDRPRHREYAEPPGVELLVLTAPAAAPAPAPVPAAPPATASASLLGVPVRSKSRNPMALTGFILGLVAAACVLSLVGTLVAPLPGIPALVFGSIGLRASYRHESSGRSRAWWGLSLGALGVIQWVVIFAIVLMNQR